MYSTGHSTGVLKLPPASPCFLHPPAVTPRPRHRPRAGGRRGDPTRGLPGSARPAPEYVGPGRPAAALGTRAAGPAPGAACGREPPAPLTRGLTAGGPAPGSALAAPAPAGRAGPPPCSPP